MPDDPVFPEQVFPEEVFPTPVFPGTGFDLTFALTGVAGTGGIGSVGIINTTGLTSGVSGTVSVGSVGQSESVALTGSALTGSVGTVTVGSDIILALTGVSSAVTVNSILARSDVAVSNVSGLSFVGSIGTVQVVIALPKNPLTVSLGTINPNHSMALTSGGSVSATGFVGVVLGPQDVSVRLNGVSMNAFVGSVSLQTGINRHSGAAPNARVSVADLYSLVEEFELVEA